MKTRYAIVLPWISALALAACSDNGDGGQTGTAGSATVAGSSGTAGMPSGGSASGTAGAGGSAGSAGAAVAGNTTGGVAGGAGGSGGASGGMAGSGGMAVGPVKPVMRDGKWALDFGGVTLEVDPMLGGRITTFKLGTENLLTGPAVNPTYWGSTLWISPEATKWMQPPPAVLDTDPYAVTMTDTSVTLSSMPYAMLGVSVAKTFSVDTKLGGFVIEYKLTNTQQTAIQMAPWEVTRVLPRGLTFFPKGPTAPTLSMGATMPTTDVGGVIWYAYDMNAVTKDSKLYADGAEGWVAHAAAGLVFIKSFGDLTVDKIAPKEGDVELYTNAVHTYIEMEDQGAYGDIAPGASVSWKVTWFLRKLPAGVEATAGNAALAQFVRDTVAGK